MDKPEALWLANELPWVKHTADWVVCNLAAAELRRLQIQNAELTENLERKSTAIQRIWKERDDLRKQRGALLEALQELCDTLGECGMTERARAAIKAVEENT